MSEPRECSDEPTSGAEHVRAASTLVVGKVLATLSDALVPILLVRILGKGDVGVLVAILLAYGTIAMVLTAGFPATLMYFMPTRDHAGRRAVAWRTTACMFGLGFLAAIFMAAVGAIGWVRPSWVSGFTSGTAVGGAGILYFFGLALHPIGEIPSRILQNLLIVEKNATGAMWFGVFKSLGTTIATVVPLLLGGTLWSVVWALSVFGVVQGVVVLWVLYRLYHDAPRTDSEVSVRDLFRFAVPIGVTDMIANINSSFDRWLIVLAFPVAMLAEYQAGAWQIPIITSIPYMVGAVYTPTFTKLLADGRAEEAISVWRTSIQKVSLLVVPLTMVFVVGAEETMRLLFTSEYSLAAQIFRWYTLMTLGRVAAYGSVIVAAGKPEFVMRAAFLSLVSNVALSVPFMALLGFLGPAVGTTLAFIPTVMAYCWYVATATGLKFRGIFPLVDYSKVLVVAVIPTALAWAFKAFVPGDAAMKLAAEAAILLASFAIIGTLSGQITAEDWKVVRGLVKRPVSA